MTDKRSQKQNLDIHVGLALKRARLNEGLRVNDVAKVSGISQGMVSKIENGNTSASLETLSKLCQAVGLPLSRLFSSFEQSQNDVQFIKAGTGMEVAGRGTDKGHKYHLLSYHRGRKKNYDPFLITMDDLSETFPLFSHPGEEMIYLLEGKLDYRYGDQIFEMDPGDCLSFSAETPHGPEKLNQVPIKMLSIINYSDDEQ